MRRTRSSTQAVSKALLASKAVAPDTSTVDLSNPNIKICGNGRKRRIVQNPSPSTPPPKTTKKAIDKSAILTLTPAQISLMTENYSTGDIDDTTPPPLPEDRLAEPHVTNAPLKTPGGSRVVTYSRDVVESSPSKTGLPRPTTTTNQLLEEACAHLLKVEPRLAPVIEKYQCRIFSPEGLSEQIDPFRSLSTGIMGQQVSGAAAKSIKNKFILLFNQKHAESTEQGIYPFPTPAQVADCDITFLRQAGLSGRKAEYIKGLAEKFVTGELSAKMLIEASYEEVFEKLIAVRGLGKWSVEMFACFALKRMDVFSTGDLGVQ